MNATNPGAGALTSGQPLPFPPALKPENGLSASQWGMASFLVSEAAFFSTLLTVYAAFLRSHQAGPTPAVLALPLVIATTLCLLSSSVTIHFAVKALKLGNDLVFQRWWAATILLGALFLAGTAYEWRTLMIEHDLTISRNLFGTTYYTVVGFHALHVSAGVCVMLTVLALSLCKTAMTKNSVELVSWYWHFVDVVWIAVFTLVYVAGRF